MFVVVLYFLVVMLWLHVPINSSKCGLLSVAASLALILRGITLVKHFLLLMVLKLTQKERELASVGTLGPRNLDRGLVTRRLLVGFYYAQSQAFN
jgi:hypothetical protein